MDHFKYQDGKLFAEKLAVETIADEIGTPFYLYSTATLTHHYRTIDEALAGLRHCVFYAMKAASNQAILKTLVAEGAGMDVVSSGEYARAIAAGVSPDKIVFSGIGKTKEEIQMALAGGIRQFNIESETEMKLLSSIAVEMKTTAPITVRINPDVDAKTHEKISTGKAENKFGIPISRARAVYAIATELPNLEVIGIDVHIGSQLTTLEPFETAYKKIADLTTVLRNDGHKIERLDLGGGLGIPYNSLSETPPLPSKYGELVKRTVGHLDCEIEIEPGRLIVGNAAILVSKVIYIKSGEERNFLILDAAMNDLIRPAMYDSWHDIIPINEPLAEHETAHIDIVGPICETGDTFARQRLMPPLISGDLVAFRSAGAYGAVMSSEYNSRRLIPEVMVNGDQFAIIRARPTFDDMINRDIIPKWLK
ncbi:MAG: diaminopimelate decarboxylase [Aestuariivita sp.]|nr:diaminopimelate decarboxylase [Aestuariivita sp.]